jgi:hypothetical protein
MDHSVYMCVVVHFDILNIFADSSLSNKYRDTEEMANLHRWMYFPISSVLHCFHLLYTTFVLKYKPF